MKQKNTTYKIGPVYRYPFIDSLRCIAILGVMVAHCSQQIRGLPEWFQALAIQGSRGVQLFFIASALTLFLSINNRSKKESAATYNFFIRRFFRITPLFYMAIILYTSLDGFSPREWAPEGITWLHIVSTFTFTNGWHPTYITSVVPGGWSIAVEMTFYLFVPFLYKKIKNMSTGLWATLIILFISMLVQFIATKWISLIFHIKYVYLVKPFTFLWFPTQAPIFFLGIILYFLLKEKLDDTNHGSRLILNRTPELFLMISIYLFFALAFGDFPLIPRHFLYGISFVTLSYALAINPYHLFVNRTICYIGKISFSVYIWHFIPIRIMNKKMPIMVDLIPQSNMRFLVFFIITVITAVFIASFSYKYIEVPGMKLGRYFLKKG